MGELVDIEHRHLRGAIEFAVDVAAEMDKRRVAVQFPPELRRHFGGKRIPNGALGRLRRAIEADDNFRTSLGTAATPELVDAVGLLWLSQPTGWQATARDHIDAAAAEHEQRDAAAALRKAEKRRAAAEQVAVRTRAELVGLNATIERLRGEFDDLRADMAKADERVAEMRVEVVDVRNEARHARDREASAVARLDAALAELDAERAADRATPPGPHDARSGTKMDAGTNLDAGTDAADHNGAAVLSARQQRALAAAADVARGLAEQLASVLPSDPSATTPERDSSAGPGDARSRGGGPPADGVATRRKTSGRRTPLRLPGGVISTSAEAATFLARSGALMIVDGYNVAMLGWPTLSLERQRNQLIGRLENLARRYDTPITVVFDGSNVVGAHTARRSLTRIMYSPDGVIADDIIREQVDRLDVADAVVVVTNDAEIVRDVRAAGANTLPSNALLAII